MAIERGNVTSHNHSSKIYGSTSKQSFLTETAICVVEQWKKSMGCCLVPECSHAQQSHACPCLSFLSAIFAGPKICSHGNVTGRLLPLMTPFAICTSPIRHLVCPPKLCITFFFLFLLSITVVPREIKGNTYAKFPGANKVHYWRFAK